MEFKCKDTYNKTAWSGRITNIVGFGSHIEFVIISRSYIKVLIGNTSMGGFACMPDYNAGCYIADLSDKFWNTEQLVGVIGDVDGITVGEALYQLGAQGIVNADSSTPFYISGSVPNN